MVKPPDRRARRREQTRSEILDHTLQIMAEDGADRMTCGRGNGVQTP
jgi:AcrR family transcriptional regulator